jgi:ATP-dependent Clp protease ATP-binding subunit ClpA
MVDGMTQSIKLDDLISAIVKVHDDPLDQLQDAALAAQHLGDLADHLLGHFVDQARRSGASWSDIGEALGVTRQAAQKRFVPGKDSKQDFSRFTPRAQKVVTASLTDAQTRKIAFIEPANLAVALFTQPDGLAAKALQAQGVTVDKFTEKLELPGPAENPPALVPFSADAKKALEQTFREALRLGHNYVGTEHILLALLETENGDGPLHAAGVTKSATEEFVAKVLSAFE